MKLIDFRIWRRRERSVEERLASARRSSIAAGVVLWTFWIVMALASLVLGEYMRAVGEFFFAVYVVVIGAFALQHKRAIDASFSLMLHGIFTRRAAEALMNDGPAITLDGLCASCGQPAVNAQNGFLTCMSGHQVHLDCQTREDGHLRCPMCLRHAHS